MLNFSDFWLLTLVFFLTESLLCRAPLLLQRALEMIPSLHPVVLHLWLECVCVCFVCVSLVQCSHSLPRSMSEAFGLWEYGVPLYTASSSFSFTCVMVSQFRLFTVTSGAFSFSGFTQCSVCRAEGRG